MKNIGRYFVFTLFILMTASLLYNLKSKINAPERTFTHKFADHLFANNETKIRESIQTDTWIYATEEVQQSIFNVTTRYLNNIVFQVHQSNRNNNSALNSNQESIQITKNIIESVTYWQSPKTLSFLLALAINPSYPKEIKDAALESFDKIQKQIHNPDYEAFRYSYLSPEVATVSE